MATAQKGIQKTAKFLVYVLGRQPDEFGLVLDDEGYVKTKELLKAIKDEPEWRHLSMGHLKEALVTVQPAVIEIRNHMIRAVERDQLPTLTRDPTLPKILYTSVRRRAYPVVLKKGIRPGAGPNVVMTAAEEMAERIGKRLDNAPVVLRVHSDKARAAEIRIVKYGKHLYLADFVPPGVFSGPPLPKEREKPVKPQPVPVEPKTPGSYYPDLSFIEVMRPDKEKRRRRRDQNQKKKHRPPSKP